MKALEENKFSGNGTFFFRVQGVRSPHPDLFLSSSTCGGLLNTIPGSIASHQFHSGADGLRVVLQALFYDQLPSLSCVALLLLPSAIRRILDASPGLFRRSKAWAHLIKSPGSG